MQIMFTACFIQVILLEESWSEIFLLCAIQWSMPMDSSPLLVAQDHEQQPNGKTGPTDIRILKDVFARFKSVQVDPAEFACMKAVALFKPGLFDENSFQKSLHLYIIFFLLKYVLFGC